MNCLANKSTRPLIQLPGVAFPRTAFGARQHAAFTLIEVMIALMIFFAAVFTILGVVSNALRNARVLQRKTVDAGLVAAQSFFITSTTNKVYEGIETGDFDKDYPDYEWTTDTYEYATNGLYQVDIVVQQKSGGQVISKTAIFVFNGNSPGSLTRGIAR